MDAVPTANHSLGGPSASSAPITMQTTPPPARSPRQAGQTARFTIPRTSNTRPSRKIGIPIVRIEMNPNPIRKPARAK
jgi:hypothetical protein